MRLPRRAFGDFTVAKQDVSIEVQSVEPAGERDANADPQALTKRTCCYVRKGQARCGMAFQIGVNAPEFQ